MSAVRALVTFVIAVQATGAWAWQSSGGGAFVTAAALAVDAQGDAVVVGSNSGSAGDTLFVAKLAGTSGVVRWHTVVHGPVEFSQDRLEAVALDAQGDVLAVGSLYRPREVLVVKLSGATGAEIWRYAARGCSPLAVGVAVDAAGDVLAAPVCEGSDTVFSVLKLAGASGEVRWRQALPGSAGWVRVAVDARGDVVAAGSRADRFTVMKVSGADGGLLWRRTLGRGWANGVAVDASGNVMALGRAGGARNFAVVKLAGRSGRLRWRRDIRGSGRTVYDVEEEAYRHPEHEGLALAVMPPGDVVAGGYLQNLRTAEDFFVVRLSGRGGQERWRRVFKGVGLNYRDDTTTRNVDDRATTLSVDSRGDVIAAGRIEVPAVCLGLGVVKLARRDGQELWRFQGCEGAGMATAVALDSAGDPVVGAVDAGHGGAPVRKLRGDTGADF